MLDPFRTYWPSFGLLAALVCCAAAAVADNQLSDLATRSTEPPLVCEVAILGGGAAGLHTAYRLGPSLGSEVCVFEKEERLGGRIHDVARTPSDASFKSSINTLVTHFGLDLPGATVGETAEPRTAATPGPRRRGRDRHR